MWMIWKTKNDVVFNKKLQSSPQAIIYKTLMLGDQDLAPAVEAKAESRGGRHDISALGKCLLDSSLLSEVMVVL
jgi:hypothetical protein